MLILIRTIRQVHMHIYCEDMRFKKVEQGKTTDSNNRTRVEFKGQTNGPK